MLFFAIHDDLAIEKARRRPSGARCAGQPHSRIETLLDKTQGDIIQYSLFTTEQMDAASDVEQQPFRTVESDERGVAIAPVGKAFQEPEVGFRVGLYHLD